MFTDAYSHNQLSCYSSFPLQRLPMVILIPTTLPLIGSVISHHSFNVISIPFLPSLLLDAILLKSSLLAQLLAYQCQLKHTRLIHSSIMAQRTWVKSRRSEPNSECNMERTYQLQQHTYAHIHACTDVLDKSVHWFPRRWCYSDNPPPQSGYLWRSLGKSMCPYKVSLFQRWFCTHLYVCT